MAEPLPETQPEPTPDRIAALLKLQGGVISHRQAVSHGISRGAIYAALEAGRWQRLHRGIYATFSGPPPRESQLWSAVLYAGPGATLSHATAAEIDGLADEESAVVHVTVPGQRRVRPSPGIRIHYSKHISQRCHPVRTPPRTRIEATVLDLVDAATNVDAVYRWITRACQRWLTTPERLLTALGERAKISWRAEVGAAVADVAEGAETPLEIEYVRKVERAHRLPVGVRQVRDGSRRRDVEYGEFGVRVELDGRIGHVEDGAFRDMDRDNASTADGFATLRYGHSQVFGDSCRAAAQVALVLQQHGWRGHPRPCGRECPIPPPPDS